MTHSTDQGAVSRRGTRPVVVAALAALLAGFLTLVSPAPAQAATQELKGVFALDPGQIVNGQVKGSYFRMVQVGGNLSSGPFLSNGSSSLSDQTYTPFTPGTDGGLLAGSYQPQPTPGFDSGGGSLSGRIIDPTPFFGINFGVSTNAVDLQTGESTAIPRIFVDEAGNLSGDLRAFDASWNTQQFNQGSPKPNGTRPGLTADPRGTYDPMTGRYTLDWSSLIVGGPFDKFTGSWHFEGTFTPDEDPDGTAPVLGDVTRTSGGFTVPILNLDSSPGATYELAVAPGVASRAGDVITVSGLAPAQTANLAVTAKKPGRKDATTQITGTSLPAVATPTTSAVTRTVRGYVFTITNFDAGTAYAVSTTAGVVARNGAKVAVGSLKPNQSATVAITASKPGFASVVKRVVNKALAAGVAPTFSKVTKTKGGFKVTIKNYAASTKYVVTTTAGKAKRSGKTLTVTGLKKGKKATVTVTATAVGATSASTKVAGTAG